MVQKMKTEKAKKLLLIAVRYGLDVADAVDRYKRRKASTRDIARMAGVADSTAHRWVVAVHGHASAKRTRRAA